MVGAAVKRRRGFRRRGEVQWTKGYGHEARVWSGRFLTACVNLLVSGRARGGCRRRADGWPYFQATDNDDETP